MRTRRFLPIVLLTLATGCGYNRIVNEEQQVEASWGQVESQLQRRADLIPNLVEVVKGYASHEKGVFDNIANARAAMVGAGSRADKIAASNQLDGAISFGTLLSIVGLECHGCFLCVDGCQQLCRGKTRRLAFRRRLRLLLSPNEVLSAAPCFQPRHDRATGTLPTLLRSARSALFCAESVPRHESWLPHST